MLNEYEKYVEIFVQYGLFFFTFANGMKLIKFIDILCNKNNNIYNSWS